MSRTIVKIPFTNFEETNTTIRNIMLSHNYKERFDGKGSYWKKGIGIFAAPKMIKFEFTQSEVVVSAWISSFGAESDLSGIIGLVPKKQLLEIIQQCKYSIK